MGFLGFYFFVVSMKFKWIGIKKFLLTTTLVLTILITSVSSTGLSNYSASDEVKLSGLLTAESTAAVLTTDYFGSSYLSFVDTSRYNVIRTNVGPTNGDDIIRYYDGKLYVVNRFGFDRIDVFDAANYSYLYNFSTPPGSNPQDIVVVSNDKAYISCYDTAEMLVVNPSTGERLGSIDFSSLADADGVPEMQRMTMVRFLGHRRVYVNVQRLNRSNFFAPTDTSFLVELDADKDEIINVIRLHGKNPSSTPILDGYSLIVTCTGSWLNVSDGGVERVNLLTKESSGFIITETDLHGNIIEYDYFPRRIGLTGFISTLLEERLGFSFIKHYEVCLISDQYWNTKVLSRICNSGSFNVMYEADGYQLTDLAITRKGRIFLCERSPGRHGLHVFNIWNGERLTTSPINTGDLPPVSIALY
jgi:hypothetical protein